MYFDAEADALSQAMIGYANRYSTPAANEALGRRLANDHPTLQQGVMRMFVAFVRQMAAKSYTDARNDASATLARQLVEQWGDGPALPLI